ncbi:MAG TPA: oligosaccharide flippase family protein, partial [Syntrophobacteraceae bacterium]|nr:oligosaccharide flippase family protein [Syntrophobacteraceae bacterium]
MPVRTEEESLGTRVARGGIWVALSSWFNVVFGFLANIVLTRLLSPEDFGIFALGMFFFSLLNLRPRIGIGQAFAQRRETDGELIGTHLALDLTAGLCTLLIVSLSLPVLGWFEYPVEVGWATLALGIIGISDSVLGTAWVMLDKELHFSKTSLVSSLAFPLSYVPGLWLAWKGGGYWSIVVQNGAYALLLLGGMWWTARRKLPELWNLPWRWNGRTARELVRFGGVVGLASIAGLLVNQLDNYLVGTFLGLATLGFYDRAWRIAMWPSLLVGNVIHRAGFFTYARFQGDPERLRRVVMLTVWLVATLALPLALAVFVSARDLVELLYGPRWVPSALLLRFLVALSVLRPLQDNAGSFFMAVGRPGLPARMTAIQAGVLALSAVPLTLAYGAVGTCLGVGISYAVSLPLLYRPLFRTLELSPADTVVLPALAACLALGVSWVFSDRVGLETLSLAGKVLVKGAV